MPDTPWHIQWLTAKAYACMHVPVEVFLLIWRVD